MMTLQFQIHNDLQHLQLLLRDIRYFNTEMLILQRLYLKTKCLFYSFIKEIFSSVLCRMLILRDHSISMGDWLYKMEGGGGGHDSK